MRILIHGINYAPEPTGTGKYTGEMVEWLSAKGHEVRVITAPPYYPEWAIRVGYSSWRYRKDQAGTDEHGATVWRCPLWVPKKPNGIKRLIHLASFAITSAPVMLAQARWKPELVVCIAPTLACAPVALLTARWSARSVSWLHVQDFEVDAAFHMGMLRSELGRRVFLWIERNLFCRFDRVSTISERMVERLADKGVPPERRTQFPNWTELTSIRPLGYPSPLRAELGLQDDQIVVLYAGNLGEKQGLEILVEAAKMTEGNARIVWVIAGAGSARSRLQRLASDCRNIRWLPLQPVSRLNELLNLAEIHVLPQRADAADLVMPSKLTNMLASGRPVVATAAPHTQLAQVVDGHGIVVQPEDAESLSKAVAELASDESRRRDLGAKARAYAEKFLDCDKIMGQFEREAATLVAGTAGAR